MNFLFVALGGALGAVARYAISLIPAKTQFPVLTLITNILGAILIGFIVGVTDKKANVSPYTVLFWKTGVCGGFTTFSTFSLEAYKLFEDGAYVPGGVYVGLSVCCCIFGIFLGKKMAAIVGS
ncbi:MAG: fluoride efflux transporter CrcB [Lachnospiraceae bacterium]|nr:fluoride efflux transporter CrcB [Lachnospiraceae bacterium]